MKKILFVCKHNIFRSRVAENLFNKLNKNKRYRASSAGIILWTKKDASKEPGYIAEGRAARNFGINLILNSKPITSSLLKETDILIIVADDVSEKLIKTEQAFNGRVLVWKIPDVKRWDNNKEKRAEKTIKYIEKEVKKLVKNLK